jgi:hypothetical protein
MPQRFRWSSWSWTDAYQARPGIIHATFVDRVPISEAVLSCASCLRYYHFKVVSIPTSNYGLLFTLHSPRYWWGSDEVDRRIALQFSRWICLDDGVWSWTQSSYWVDPSLRRSLSTCSLGHGVNHFVERSLPRDTLACVWKLCAVAWWSFHHKYRRNALLPALERVGAICTKFSIMSWPLYTIAPVSRFPLELYPCNCYQHRLPADSTSFVLFLSIPMSTFSTPFYSGRGVQHFVHRCEISFL